MVAMSSVRWPPTSAAHSASSTPRHAMVMPRYLPRCPACPACSMCSANSSTSPISPSLSVLCSMPGSPRWILSFVLLPPNIFAEHFFGVDGDERAAAAGQDFIFLVHDLGGVGVFVTADLHFPALDPERFVQWDRLEVFDGHFSGKGDYVAEFVDLAHGIVEDGRDDA